LIIFDHTAVLALARGHRTLSGMVHRDVPADRRSYVPALCLVAAARERPGIAAHLGALPGLDFLELDYPATEAVERTLAAGVAWEHGHAIYVAALDPAVNVVLSRAPKVYDGMGLRVADITELP
jgi:hypothetical protein